jgi:hypothetical protein
MMKEPARRVSSGFVLLLAALLSACSSGSGTSTSRKPSSFTVEYYDDATTPVRVGYSYVMPNGNASTIGHADAAYDNNTAYDFASRSGISPSKAGNHWVFDAWSGVKADNTPVDLTKITEDCKVYAHFKEEAYTFNVSYYNDDMIKDSALSQSGLSWGSQPTYPSSYTSYQQPDYTGATVVKNGFWGYDFGNPNNALSPNPDFYWKNDADKKSIPSSWTFVSDAARPDAVPAAGTLFAVTSLNDSHGTNPTYPISLSNGTSWLDIGSLANGLTIPLYASYGKKAHSFTVAFYDGDPDLAGSTAILKGSLSVPFQDVFTLSANGTSFTASYASETVTFASASKSWTSRFVHCSEVNPYYGKEVQANRIMADAIYFPAV